MGEKKVIYIAGPITGVERYWEAFERAEDEIRAKGHIPLTPTRIPWDLSNDKAMKICLAMIDQADVVYFLPGWDESKGARLEMSYCEYTGKPTSTNIALIEEVLR